MKRWKIVGIVCLWLVICSNHVYSRSKPVEFEIRYDSHTKQTYQIKKQMQEEFDDLVSDIHKDDQYIMIVHNIKRFEFKKNIKAIWKDKLIIKEGDGKGSVVEGELSSRSYCVEKVQPRSFLQELFQGFGKK